VSDRRTLWVPKYEPAESEKVGAAGIGSIGSVQLAGAAVSEGCDAPARSYSKTLRPGGAERRWVEGGGVIAIAR